MTPRETEIKLAVAGAAEARELLNRLHARVHQERHFEENLVFDTPDLKLRSQGMLLRVRIVNDRGTLTYKGVSSISDGVKDREEIESTTESPQSLVTILERLGYSIKFRYQKYRTTYEIANLKLHVLLDETPIGTYLELEGDIADIHRCAEQLGFDRSAYITESYLALYLRWCRENDRTPAHMVFA